MWKFILFAVFSVLWAFIASQGLDGVGKHSKTGCNTTHKVNTSGFELNFHNLSRPCYWNITAPGLVRLFFTSVFLRDTDKLTLYRNWTEAEAGINPIFKDPIPSQNGTMTIITNEDTVVIKLVGGEDPNFSRVFTGQYSSDACTLPVDPDIETLYSPIYVEDVPEKVLCVYNFNLIQHKRVKQVFTFEEFDMPSSTVEIDGGTFSGEYKKETATDFFMDTNKHVLSIHVTQALNSTDHFRLKMHEVDSECSGRYELSDIHKSFTSPKNILNNGSITYECRWLVQDKLPTHILGIKFDKIDFSSVFDIAAVNDGASEISTPLLQVTTSNRNVSQNQVIRASGASLWISFKPLSYESSFNFNVTVHGQGGYFKNNGEIKMQPTTGDDTYFLLEVDTKEVVMLTFDESSIVPPAKVSVYDGFDSNNLLTTLHGNINFPIFSRSSRMMIAGTNFSAAANHFTAKFKGIIQGCDHMSSLSTENYILSENCNSSCAWIIPPQDAPNSALVVYLQYISLKAGDNLKVHQLDSTLTELVEFGANVTHMPHFSVPADIGILINVTQSSCKQKTDKIVVIGHSSYIPACTHDITPKLHESFQISSPLYPDTYPVFTSCQWNITAPKNSIVHMAFQNLNLAKNHYIQISKDSSSSNKFEGNILPDDLFLSGDVLVDFNSSDYSKMEVGSVLNSGSGFLVNVTVTDCGAVLDGKKSGEFNTSISPNISVCIWKISVPPKDGSSVNIISYVIDKKDSLQNYKLDLYDGSSVRDSEIQNNTGTIWSRTNTLIFIYRRLNVSEKSSVFVFKYNTISCNTSMQCKNSICMHPDWRCDGNNDCGDFSDERNCAPVPIPPEIQYTGYSAAAFWLCILAMLAIGVILGVTVPVCYQKYKDSRYNRFHELES